MHVLGMADYMHIIWSYLFSSWWPYMELQVTCHLNMGITLSHYFLLLWVHFLRYCNHFFLEHVAIMDYRFSHGINAVFFVKPPNLAGFPLDSHFGWSQYCIHKNMFFPFILLLDCELWFSSYKWSHALASSVCGPVSEGRLLSGIISPL